MTALRNSALALRFLLELAALAALFAASWSIVDGFAGVVVGIAAVGLAAVAWGLFVAPRARIALATPARLAVEVAVFAAASGGLLLAGHGGWSAALAGLYVLDRLALWISGAPVYEPSPGSAPSKPAG